MRFFPDGPHIPNRLLADHERGNVVFLCGAGVSVAAGLPNFEDLAKKLVDRLGAPVNATSRVLIERARQAKALGIPAPTDVVISQLQREYTPDQLIEAVAAELRCPEDYDYSFHRTITRLSRNPEGLPRLVTTNFENLFELADPKLRPVLPPSLPDLGLRQPLDGLVYLHGKLGERQGRPVALSDLILGSGDFGRAYLAHGWATRFLRQLLSSYSVVLVGYSASDPPVQYLLEGLVTDPATSSTKIYAFIPSGSPEDVQLWANRGVHPIIYAWDKPHLKLWETLSAWADLADDPVRWRAKIIAKATQGAAAANAVERGQAVYLVSTVEGAKAWSEAEPPPTPDWLCTFDRALRYTEPRAQWDEDQKFDPLSVFGLDDDPPRSTTPQLGSAVLGLDSLAANAEDEQPNEHRHVSHPSENPLPERLFHLARWIGRISDHPATA